MLQKVCLKGLWISTLVILLITAIQSISGNWITFYFIWTGFPANNQTFIQAMAKLATYHERAGIVIGVISVLIVIFAFLSKSGIWVRIFSVLGLIVTAVAAYGGYLYVHSGLTDRWSLGQMADASVGVLAAFLVLLFFMRTSPGFPWHRKKALT